MATQANKGRRAKNQTEVIQAAREAINDWTLTVNHLFYMSKLSLWTTQALQFNALIQVKSILTAKPADTKLCKNMKPGFHIFWLRYFGRGYSAGGAGAAAGWLTRDDSAATPMGALASQGST